MDELQTTMTIYRVWGSHLGSSQLFKQHLESRRRITEFVEKVQVRHFFFFNLSCILYIAVSVLCTAHFGILKVFIHIGYLT